MLLSMGICLLLRIHSQTSVVVSPRGSDINPGTERLPMATLAGARDRARLIQAHSIVVEGGAYQLSDTLDLDKRDSGLTIQAAKGAKPLVSGAIEIPWLAAKLSQDATVLDRLIDVNARRLVMEVDLRAFGLLSLDAIQPRGFPHSAAQAPNELFQGEAAMTLARWPNKGFAKVGKITEAGNGESDHHKPARRPIFGFSERAAKWSQAEDLWMYGYWKFDWADESIRVHQIDSANGNITLENPAVYGVDSGSPFFVENLIEELDARGEYYVDRKNLHLYFIPLTGSVRRATLRLSVLNKPMISISDAANVTIQGLTFAYSRGDGAGVHNCDHVRFQDCKFANLGERAAEIERGHDCGLMNCDVTATAEGGVRLAGGDRNTLEPARNYVEDCEFQNFERRSQTYRPAVWLEGVGNRVSHCFIHDAPHSAIIYGGNDHLIEYNHFARTISLTGDGGVVYTGRDWTARGTKIQFNWFEDNVGQRKWEPAIYVDDLGSGINMVGNLIERCHWGFLIGGGRNNVLQDNILVDCDLAFDCDARGLGWAAKSKPTMMQRLLAVPYQSAKWRTSYLGLPNILAEDPMAPMGNTLKSNLLIRAGKVMDRMEAAFQKTASIQDNREGAQPTPAEVRTIESIRSNAGIRRVLPKQ